MDPFVRCGVVTVSVFERERKKFIWHAGGMYQKGQSRVTKQTIPHAHTHNHTLVRVRRGGGRCPSPFDDETAYNPVADVVEAILLLLLLRMLLLLLLP